MNRLLKAALLLGAALSFYASGEICAEGPQSSEKNIQAEETTLEGAMAHGNYKRALAIATDLVELYPGKASVYEERSTIYSMMHRMKPALADIGKAIELSPADPSLLMERGIIYYHMKKYDPALADYESALAMNPSFPPLRSSIYTGLSYVYADLGNIGEALGNARLAQGQNPFDPEAYRAEAHVYELQGNREKAQKVISRGMSYVSAHQGNFLAAGICAQQAGEMDMALEFLNRAEKQDKDNAEVYSARGLVYALTGRPEKGIEDLTKALKKRDNSMDYNNRGECWRDLKKYDKARADYEKSVSLAKNKNDFHAVYDSIGQMYMNVGNYKEAEKYFTKSIEQEEYREGYEFRARARRIMGKEAAAKRDEERAAKFKK